MKENKEVNMIEIIDEAVDNISQEILKLEGTRNAYLKLKEFYSVNKIKSFKEEEVEETKKEEKKDKE